MTIVLKMKIDVGLESEASSVGPYSLETSHGCVDNIYSLLATKKS